MATPMVQCSPDWQDGFGDGSNVGSHDGGRASPGSATPGGDEPVSLACEGQPREAPDCTPLGTNLTMPAYYTSSYPFVDLMKMTFEFTSGSEGAWDDGRPVDVDEHGWLRSLQPGQIARLVILDSERPHPTGRFTVLYEGEGTIEYHGGVQNLQRSPGRDTFDLTDGGLFINITSVSSGDPLRDIRILPPGGQCGDDLFAYCESDSDCGGTSCVPFEETHEQQPFHPQFLEEVRSFRVLRFMDWMHTNREVGQEDGVDEPMPIGRIGEYPMREDRSWRPVPIGVMVDLANILDADAWFNIPHRADDEFVDSMASRVAARLDSHLKVYLEYTNEGWNQIFDQHFWINEQGCREYSSNPGAECDGDGDGELCEHGDWDSYGHCREYGDRWFAVRTAEVGRTFRQAFHSNPERVIRVLGTQIGGNWFFERMLREQLPNGEPVHEHVDAVSVAPYFWFAGEANSVDHLFSRVQMPDGSNPYRLLFGDPENTDDAVGDLIRKDMAVLSKPEFEHLDYIAYEAGQGLFDYDPDQASLFLEANRDNRMRDVYDEYLQLWTELTGGQLLVHFSSATTSGWYGSWGMKEYQGQPRDEAPKFDALMSYLEGNCGCGDPRWD